MDKTIAKHLAKRGMTPTKPRKEDLTFSERNPDFFKWFHESVMGFDSEEYRREFWREARRTGHTIGHVPYGLKEYHRRRDTRLEGAAIIMELLVGGGALAVWLIRRMVDRHIQRLRRPTYYETERARRLGLAEERRRIRRRRTTNAMPGNEELIEAFRKAKDSPINMIRFGSLIEDLECYVDNTPYFKNGQLVGRRGGIRRYLEREIPELYARYKTVMKYKALSKKFRQATGVADPVPAVSLLPEENTQRQSGGNENSVRNEISRNRRDRIDRHGAEGKETATKDTMAKKAAKSGISAGNIPVRTISIGDAATEMTSAIPVDDIQARKIQAREILEACEGTVVSLVLTFHLLLLQR